VAISRFIIDFFTCLYSYKQEYRTICCGNGSNRPHCHYCTDLLCQDKSLPLFHNVPSYTSEMGNWSANTPKVTIPTGDLDSHQISGPSGHADLSPNDISVGSAILQCSQLWQLSHRQTENATSSKAIKCIYVVQMTQPNINNRHKPLTGTSCNFTQLGVVFWKEVENGIVHAL